MNFKEKYWMKTIEYMSGHYIKTNIIKGKVEVESSHMNETYNNRYYERIKESVR